MNQKNVKTLLTELDRRAAIVLHQHGLEVTPNEVGANRETAYRVIRDIFKVNGKLVPKSDADMVRFLKSLQPAMKNFNP